MTILNKNRSQRLHRLQTDTGTLAGLAALLLLCTFNAHATQAHVNLYFPHVVLGGPSSDQWTAEILVSNPGSFTDASVRFEFVSKTGTVQRGVRFTPVSQRSSDTLIASGASRRFAVTSSNTIRTLQGWVRGEATVPLIGMLNLYRTKNGRRTETINVPSIVPAGENRFQLLGPTRIFLLNRDDAQSASIDVELYSANGNIIKNRRELLLPLSTADFMESDTRGSILSLSPTESSSIQTFVAGALPIAQTTSLVGTYVASGGSVHSLRKPHKEQMMLQFRRIEDAAKGFSSVISEYYLSEGDRYAANRFRHVFDGVRLEIPTDIMVNAYARNGSTIGISLGLLELLADSPGELAFVVGHELGHIFQQRNYELLFDRYNIEADADSWGALFCLFSGNDVYAVAGALSKLAMVTGNASLSTQIFEDVPYFEAHRSFNTRMSNVFEMFSSLCNSSSVMREFCASYKEIAHPSLPSVAPLEDGLWGNRVRE